jgi:hypothetical protein
MHRNDELRETMLRLGERRERFAHDLVADLARRHPAVLARGAELPADRVLDALETFAATHALGPEAPATQDVTDLADSLMKCFAQALGRAQWTPGLALAWHGALRRSGARLLDDLRNAARS